MQRYHDPPKIPVTPVIKKTFRFFDTVGASYSPSGADIQGWISGYASATQITPLITKIRYKRISVWGPAPTSLNAASSRVEWLEGADSIRVNGASISTASPTFVEVRPPKGSIASLWNTPGSATFNIFTVANSIIDVECEITLMDATLVSGLSSYTAQTASQAGALLYPPLTWTSNNNARQVDLLD